MRPDLAFRRAATPRRNRLVVSRLLFAFGAVAVLLKVTEAMKPSISRTVSRACGCLGRASTAALRPGAVSSM